MVLHTEYEVSSPVKPGAPFALSSKVCGAWSVDITSTVPSRIASIMESLSFSSRKGGFTSAKISGSSIPVNAR